MEPDQRIITGGMNYQSFSKHHECKKNVRTKPLMAVLEKKYVVTVEVFLTNNVHIGPVSCIKTNRYPEICCQAAMMMSEEGQP